MFQVLEEELKTRILNGDIKNGFMVRDIEKGDHDRIFFDTELKAEDYMRKLSQADITKRFLVQQVTLHQQVKI